jgi:sigma-B regulation protein RsbU (phosphoserine phosphatase)
VKVDVAIVVGISFLYVALLFLVAYYAHLKHERGGSFVANPFIYSLSIAVYCTSWTFYGSVGKAATTGLDFLLIYLGPSLTAFSWWFLLRKMIRITKENNITSIADFISSRYGKSQWLGALITLIAILGIIPYIALQLKAVSTSFNIIIGHPKSALVVEVFGFPVSLHSGFFVALILSVFGVIFGARRLVSSERHEGLVAAIALESIVKLVSFVCVGIFVTYSLFDGVTDIFDRMRAQTDLFDHLTTFGGEGEPAYASWFAMLYLSMGAIMLLPRQFHIMVIENSDERHIKEAMWRFPLYLFVINLFVIPIAFGGILLTGGNKGADYFVLTLPLNSGHAWLALLAFLGGFSAAAGMVMAESVAVSTMFLNHLLMPIVVRLKPRSWFPALLINLKRLGIFLVVFLGYLYHIVIGDTYMLVNMGLISFAAAAQFGPALVGGLYWHRGNKTGALTGILLGFLVWFYTLLLPSFIKSGWWQTDLLEEGPFGLYLLRPTELFGLTGFDIYTDSLFWSLFFNIGGYLLFSIVLPQNDREKEQVRKFVDVFTPPAAEGVWETKRLSKPVTIIQFVNLMAKFIGENQAHAAIAEYLGDREIDETGGVSEFELPKLKRFIEKTLAGSVGAAAAGAIVESYLSDIGSKMESVYDIFSTVRTSLDESREALYVRLKASEIMNRTLDLQIIMDDLLELLNKEFHFDLAVIRISTAGGVLKVRSHKGDDGRSIISADRVPEIDTYIGETFLTNRPHFINDTKNITKPRSREIIELAGFASFAHIPIATEGDPPVGILSVFSRSIVGLFTEPFLQLLASLAGQLAQAVKIVAEREAKQRERQHKEEALMENARVTRELELAKQIQLSLLPDAPPEVPGVTFGCRCVPATHVGGDYYDFFRRGETLVDMVIADVSGHSVGAALIMVETRSVLRAQVTSSSRPASLMAMLNSLLYEDLTRAELFISMFYVQYDTASRILSYASAGHNLPLLYRSGAPRCEPLDAEGLILGVKPEVDFEEKSLTLVPGDVLLLYTDGITETANADQELFGEERLCTLLRACHDESPERIMAAVLTEVAAFAGGQPAEDDISMVVLKVTKAGELERG